MTDTFGARRTLAAGPVTYDYFHVGALDGHGVNTNRLPYSIRILLENVLRNEGAGGVTADHVRAVANWSANRTTEQEIAFTPARVLLQDFTGVPCVVDLAAMRDAMARFGGDPQRINPIQPVELVIDHSVQVDAFGSDQALRINVSKEFERNAERYRFLKWGQNAFRNFRAVPPSTGIVHQVNLEYLARVVFPDPDTRLAYPDTLVGTDSHTTMVNGIGVLGWGCGGIEAEAAMLGQPVSMLVPDVIGFRLTGELPEGTTATDLVLTITEILRRRGVVGKFVEFFGPGVRALSVADRATIANMAPEYGATCGIFPVDAQTLRYLQLTGRPASQIALIEAYMRAQGMFDDGTGADAEYTDVLSLDLSTVEASIAGPRRPQDRVRLSDAGAAFLRALPDLAAPAGRSGAAVSRQSVSIEIDGSQESLADGSVVIAAITSCTNTSNPAVMVAAGLLARNAVARGLKTQPWVKTSLAPGSRVVTRYLDSAGLTSCLDALGFNTVGYGCTTCIGNSGPLPEPVSAGIAQGKLVAVSVLSGNRNFEGRIQGEVRANYLMSPPLVVAYALAGRIDLDFRVDAIGTGSDGNPVYLRDIWPSNHDIETVVAQAVSTDLFRTNYEQVFAGDEHWNSIDPPAGSLYEWDPASTYIRRAPYFDNMEREAPAAVGDIEGARVLAVFGDSVTTDHISPAGSIKVGSPAAHWLTEHGVAPVDFNSYGSRRGNDEVMVRGTFANVRIRNLLAPGTEGGVTTYLPTGDVMPIYDAAAKYSETGTPLVVLAGKEYGSGSSRDWAAKGPYLQGVKLVIAQSFERIHRSNLIGMGILPLEFEEGSSVDSLGLTGSETFAVRGVASALPGSGHDACVEVSAGREGRPAVTFRARLRIDTPQEAQYYRHGGILQFVLRRLLDA